METCRKRLSAASCPRGRGGCFVSTVCEELRHGGWHEELRHGGWCEELRHGGWREEGAEQGG